jgi:hypothetical protein
LAPATPKLAKKSSDLTIGVGVPPLLPLDLARVRPGDADAVTDDDDTVFVTEIGAGLVFVETRGDATGVPGLLPTLLLTGVLPVLPVVVGSVPNDDHSPKSSSSPLDEMAEADFGTEDRGGFPLDDVPASFESSQSSSQPSAEAGLGDGFAAGPGVASPSASSRPYPEYVL